MQESQYHALGILEVKHCHDEDYALDHKPDGVEASDPINLIAQGLV